MQFYIFCLGDIIHGFSLLNIIARHFVYDDYFTSYTKFSPVNTIVLIKPSELFGIK